MLSADLHFRGFSESRIHPERKQPDTFFYGSVATQSFWNPTAGLYTRYGDVRESARSIDDRMVVMGSGDEILLHFDAASLPPLPAGWTPRFPVEGGWLGQRSRPQHRFRHSVEPAIPRYEPLSLSGR